MFPARAMAAEKPPYPSHGPASLVNNDEARKLILDRIMGPPTAKKINDHIFYSSRLENTAYVDMGRHAVIYDTGFDHQVHKHLANFEKLGCDLSKVRAILCSHSHVDHTAGSAAARDQLGVPTIAHPRAVRPMSRGDRLQTAAIIPEVDGWVFDFPACPIDHTVDHGDVIQIGDERIDVIHIPGHTPDSLGYLWRGHLFTGDAVFGGGLIGWASERWYSNYLDHAQTMKRLLETPPDARRMYATHGGDIAYSDAIPNACIKTLDRLLKRANDPCNHTPRCRRRESDDPTNVLKII